MEKLKLHTPDLTAENVKKLAALFPSCVTEARDDHGRLTQAVDFDQLRQELSSSVVEGPRERYHLDWPGKREALLAANAPIAKTLRPCRQESVDFETTKNLFIEGDNLDALKLLQEVYLNKVHVIYIDPPYNTGSDLVYRDDFRADSECYLKESNQQDESGNRLTINTESNGRFHSDWLKMFFPRLKLAWHLLRDDGVILISIDDHELANATKVCDEIFGASNFIANMVWEKGRKNDAKLVSVGHEYVLVFAKSLAHLRDARTIWREEKPGAREIWEKYIELRSQFGNDRVNIESGLQAWFSALPKAHPSKKWSRYKRVDENGPWRDRDISWPGGDGPRYDVLHPKTNLPCKVPERGWIYASPDEMKRQIKLGLVEFRDDHSQPPFRKAHIRPIPDEIEADVYSEVEDDSEEEFASQVRGSYFYKQSQVAVKYLRGLLGAKAFNNPKDHFELAKLFDYATGRNTEAIVVDFFAGSGSTAHAVMQLNHSDGGHRRFVLVQVPEPLDPSKKEQKAAARFCDDLGRPRSIAEITKERLRRAGIKFIDELRSKRAALPPELFPSTTAPDLDVGFRVLKIDTSNMKDVYYTPDAVKQGDLLGQIDNIRDGRTPEDLLFQVLVDWGVDLALPVTMELVAGKSVFFVDGNVVAACFEGDISEDLVTELAKRKPLRAVFRDSSYASDSVKINVEQLFKLLSPGTEIKSL